LGGDVSVAVGPIPGGNGLTLAATDGNTTATISTLPSWDHGSMFASIQVPDGQCCQPKFALLDATNSGSPIPEIDILDALMAGPGGTPGSGPNSNLSNVTYYQILSAPGFTQNSASYTYSQDLSFSGHVYGCTFSVTSSSVNFYFDGVLVHTTTGYPLLSGHTFSIVLTLAPQGSSAGSPTVTVTYPQNMYVDWVRVYQ
jgi:beta-glucanase (GH16 family)